MTNVSRELRYALIIKLIDRLRNAQSWCGETHLQKSAYAFEVFCNDFDEYQFIMYKHGPFSFDLRDDIAGMRAAKLVELEIHQEGYGPRLKPSHYSERLLQNNSKEIKKFDKAIDFVVNWFGKKDVKELEKLSTALFISKKHPELSTEKRAAEIKNLKPHISSIEAERAVASAERKLTEAADALKMT